MKRLVRGIHIYTLNPPKKFPRKRRRPAPGDGYNGTMRIWDLPCRILCRQHLLGEHRELHAIWNVLTKGKKGYRRHPETLRWQGKLKALYKRHEEQVRELRARGYEHRS